MGIDNESDLWLLLSGLDVPDFECALDGTNKHVVLVDLVQVSWAVLDLESLLDLSAPRLDVKLGDDHLLLMEARDSQVGRGGSGWALGSQLNHHVSLRWLWTTNKEWSNWWLNGWLLVLLLISLLVASIFLSLFLTLFVFLIRSILTALLLFLRLSLLLLWVWLGLQMCQSISITIKVEQLGDSVWLIQGRVDVDMTISTSGGEVLVLDATE